MAQYEYRVLYGSPKGHFLMPWASQELRDKMGRGSFEKQLNMLADDGWEVTSCSTASAGTLFFFSPCATVILRREKK
jgi:hypothetical protein